MRRYFSRCNTLLPLFDSVFDTFDSLRSRSAFCLAAILSVAARLSSDRADSTKLQQVCQAEAQKLAAETLFHGGSQLEIVQGMIVVAAYSKRCWYIVGHAVRLAQQMQLGRSLPDLLSLSRQSTLGTSSNLTKCTSTAKTIAAKRFTLVRQVRVWMTLAHLEQEIAVGTGRHSLIERDSNLNVRGLVDDPLFPRTDLHILGAIELLRLRSMLVSSVRK